MLIYVSIVCKGLSSRGVDRMNVCIHSIHVSAAPLSGRSRHYTFICYTNEQIQIIVVYHNLEQIPRSYWNCLIKVYNQPLLVMLSLKPPVCNQKHKRHPYDLQVAKLALCGSFCQKKKTYVNENTVY